MCTVTAIPHVRCNGRQQAVLDGSGQQTRLRSRRSAAWSWTGIRSVVSCVCVCDQLSWYSALPANTICCHFYDMFPSVLLHCWLGVRKSIRPLKVEWWDVGCGYLSGARCISFACGPADATHTHTHPFNGTFVRDYPGEPVPEGKTYLDFTEASDSKWQWHQLGFMQVCTSLQTDNCTSIPPLSFLQAGYPSCRPTNSVNALKAYPADATASQNPIIPCLI